MPRNMESDDSDESEVQEWQSDLDLTLFVDEDAAKRKHKKKTHLEILQLLSSKFRAAQKASTTNSQASNCRIRSVEKPYVMSAGALLEIKCENALPNGKQFTIDVDISINKPLEILNSQLICTYCLMDERFRKVALVLKNWNRGTEASKNNRLNSFSIYLLLLAFMLEFKYMINLQKEAP